MHRAFGVADHAACGGAEETVLQAGAVGGNDDAVDLVGGGVFDDCGARMSCLNGMEWWPRCGQASTHDRLTGPD